MALCLAVFACDEEDPPEEPPPEPVPVLLANYDAWVRVADVAQDVYGAERPEGLVCDETMGLTIEDLGPDLVLEVKTDLCNYATVQQPSLVALAAGDTVTIRVWHYELMAPEPALGHVALAIDGEPMWETWLDIPDDEFAAPSVVEGEFVVSRDIPAGAPMQWHVHNHGVNAYDLVYIKATPTGAAEAAEGER